MFHDVSADVYKSISCKKLIELLQTLDDDVRIFPHRNQELTLLSKEMEYIGFISIGLEKVELCDGDE